MLKIWKLPMASFAKKDVFPLFTAFKVFSKKEKHLHFTLPLFLPYLSETENGQFSFLFYHFNHHFLKWTSEKENSWLKTQAKFFRCFRCAYWISTLDNKKGVVVLRLLGRVLELSSWISLEDPLSSNLLTPYRVIHQEGNTSRWLGKTWLATL